MHSKAEAMIPKKENTMVALRAAGAGKRDFWYSFGKMHSIIKPVPMVIYRNQVRKMHPKSSTPKRRE